VRVCVLIVQFDLLFFLRKKQTPNRCKGEKPSGSGGAAGTDIVEEGGDEAGAFVGPLVLVGQLVQLHAPFRVLCGGGGGGRRRCRCYRFFLFLVGLILFLWCARRW
jgi:hypothetical protein